MEGETRRGILQGEHANASPMFPAAAVQSISARPKFLPPSLHFRGHHAPPAATVGEGGEVNERALLPEDSFINS